ncbi:CBASS cGAMP-activated phospholipase [Robertmurraya korlensis]|uniref:CBASS cGAMP-activated phospholipase n=1 Tax=Robertmurraya korlensis TaxID=519977 RepID=UPI00082500B5|nr:CBASS cGAMP-activated phospholipase [Robertmurraya korlensis]
MKMLCIDGGGIRGVFAVAILEELEKDIGRSIRESIDLVAGTSTGSIIAASIAVNREMGELLEDYRHYGRKIFKRRARIGLFRSIYSNRDLRRFVQNAFKEKTLEEVGVPLLIPAVNVTKGKPYVHRSHYGIHERGENDHIKLWDAVLSSCSAPIYFPPNNINNQVITIDGGLWANNPSLVCITEAKNYYGLGMEKIRILSIGLGQQRVQLPSKKTHLWGIKQWMPFQLQTMSFTPKLLDLALDLSSESISFQCQHLLGENYLRLNTELGKEVPFDQVEIVEWLIELGRQVYKEKKQEILQFLQI